MKDQVQVGLRCHLYIDEPPFFQLRYVCFQSIRTPTEVDWIEYVNSEFQSLTILVTK